MSTSTSTTEVIVLEVWCPSCGAPLQVLASNHSTTRGKDLRAPLICPQCRTEWLISLSLEPLHKMAVRVDYSADG